MREGTGREGGREGGRSHSRQLVFPPPNYNCQKILSAEPCFILYCTACTVLNCTVGTFSSVRFEYNVHVHVHVHTNSVYYSSLSLLLLSLFLRLFRTLALFVHRIVQISFADAHLPVELPLPTSCTDLHHGCWSLFFLLLSPFSFLLFPFSVFVVVVWWWSLP